MTVFSLPDASFTVKVFAARHCTGLSSSFVIMKSSKITTTSFFFASITILPSSIVPLKRYVPASVIVIVEPSTSTPSPFVLMLPSCTVMVVSSPEVASSSSLLSLSATRSWSVSALTPDASSSDDGFSSVAVLFSVCAFAVLLDTLVVVVCPHAARLMADNIVTIVIYFRFIFLLLFFCYGFLRVQPFHC